MIALQVWLTLLLYDLIITEIGSEPSLLREVTIVAVPSRPTLSRSEAFSGAVLAAGAVALFVGSIFYIRLTWRLGLPALPAERMQALADVLSLGSQKLLLAGGWAFTGDCLLLAACIVLVRRRHLQGSDLDSIGWALLGVGVAIAMIFDPITAVVFWPLAHGSDPQPFLAFKAWFDFLFGAAVVPFGLGGVAVLWADAHCKLPLLPKILSVPGIAIFAASALSGFAYLIGLLHLPLVIGFSVLLGCIPLALLGVQIARSGQAVMAASKGLGTA